MEAPVPDHQPRRPAAAPAQQPQAGGMQPASLPASVAGKILGSQRAAGNRAVSRMVQRQPAPASPAAPAPGTPVFDVNNLSAKGGPTTSGSVTSAMSAEIAGAVAITGPAINSSHTVTANADLPESIEVGYVQTLKESTRLGIYGKQGKESFRRKETTPKSRDARSYKTTGGAKSESRAPWYDSELGGVASLSAMSGSTASIRTGDQPGFVLEAREQDGSVLMGTAGDEKFTLSVAAKPFNAGSATPIPNGTVDWSFSWNQSIDASGAGSGGGQITYKSGTGEIVTSDGVVAKKAGIWWYDFQTKDEAMGHSAAVLIENLSLATAAGADGATALACTSEALKAKNPYFVATIETRTTSSLVGSDQLSVTLKGAGASQVSSIPGTVDKPAPIGFNLLSLFSDPVQFLSGITVSIEVSSDWREAKTGTVHFNSLGEMASGATVEAGSSPAGTYGIKIAL